jgi:hypothetical protein
MSAITKLGINSNPMLPTRSNSCRNGRCGAAYSKYREGMGNLQPNERQQLLSLVIYPGCKSCWDGGAFDYGDA